MSTGIGWRALGRGIRRDTSRGAAWSLVAGLAMVGLLGGCKPTYPKCDKDANCKEGEFCVNGQCQQCRADNDCGPGQRCNAGRCDAIEGFCERGEDCPDGLGCKGKRCGACDSDAECGAGRRCREGRCLSPGQCVADEDCPEGQECQGGTCAGPSADRSVPGCQPETVFFGFDQHVLSSQATGTLQRNAQCIRSVTNHGLRVEGHCDPRGTEEYNLALGDRRGRSVVSYLGRLGVDTSRLRVVAKGKLEAVGSDEESWARDRKATFVWE
ncbi:MAG: OmpA family protein [Proteobacteria bacterium]|nr:OmpA family protein [Pseudomonadota bacterium]